MVRPRVYASAVQAQDGSITGYVDGSLVLPSTPRIQRVTEQTATKDGQPLPVAQMPTHGHPGTSPLRTRSLIKIAVLLAILLALVLGSLVLLAQPTTIPLMTQMVDDMMHHPKANPSPAPSTWGTTVPAGWTTAGLTVADAFEAEHTATEFVSREMLIDFRSIGVQNAHAGTLMASSSLLSEGGKVRFAANDKRVFKAFFTQVRTQQIVQIPLDLLPYLVQFQAQGPHQFAWVQVDFYLHRDQAGVNTNDPVHHQMQILLVRVPVGDGPLGGIGWQISDYVLDMPMLPAIPARP